MTVFDVRSHPHPPLCEGGALLPRRCSTARLPPVHRRSLGFAPPPPDGFALLASATRMILSAETYPMLAMNAPYTESQSYAIPLGENFPHRGGAQCGRASHMVLHRRRTTSP